MTAMYTRACKQYASASAYMGGQMLLNLSLMLFMFAAAAR